jgi:intracellular sulfur oxidation DsrE/DsrF family protein
MNLERILERPSLVYSLDDEQWNELLSVQSAPVPRRLVIVSEMPVVIEVEVRHARSGRPKGAKNLTPLERQERALARREALKSARRTVAVCERSLRRDAIKAALNDGRTVSDVAVAFGVSQSYASLIRSGKR